MATYWTEVRGLPTPLRVLGLIVMLAITSVSSLADDCGWIRNTNPFEVFEDAAGGASGPGLQAVRRDIGASVARRDALSAAKAFLVAESMKRVGDLRAPLYYDRAIQVDRFEPAYEVFYGDYWRNFRGAGTSVFPKAERHYRLAAEKLSRIPACARKGWDDETRSRLKRGLIALHERDGLALVPRRHETAKSTGKDVRWSDPLFFLASVTRYSNGGPELDRISDVRDYTSEALESLSRLPPGGTFPDSVFAGLARSKRSIENFERLRFRYEEAPVIDVQYTFRDVTNAQVTNFADPTKFNNLRLDSVGVSGEKPLALGHWFDLDLSASYSRFHRRGLIERAPGTYENVNQYAGRAALARFIGPDKVNLELIITRQEIRAETSGAGSRGRNFDGAVFTYQIFRPLPFLQRSLATTFNRRFDLRGIDLFAGYLNDQETFLGSPNVDVFRRDRFFGVAARGLGRFDVTVQPTFFSSKAPVKPLIDNSQYRTYFTLLARLRDEEKYPGLPGGRDGFHVAFVHLVFPFRHDVPQKGLEKYRNQQFGAQLSAKFFDTGLAGTTWLATLRYDYQRFPELGRHLNAVTLSMGMGF